MQTTGDTTNFSPQMQLLANFLKSLSDKVLEHINNLDPRLGIWPTVSLFSIRRDASKQDDPFYDIQIHSKAFELTLESHFRQYRVSFEFHASGMTVREKDIERCTLNNQYYDELLKACLSDLNAPRPNSYSNPVRPGRGYGMFDANDMNNRTTQPFIKEIIVDWAHRQRNG